MILMITIAIVGFLLLVIINLIKDIYLYDFNFEISIKGLKLSFKAKEKGNHPPKD